MLRPLRATAVLIAGLMAASCGDSKGPGTAAPGTFSGQVSGSVSRTLNGAAFFASAEASDLPVLAIVLNAVGPGSEPASVIIARQGSARPAPGSYEIGDLGDAWFAQLILSGDSNSPWTSIFGQVQITGSTAQSLSGTATFTARGDLGQGQVTVTVTFRAVCVAGSGLTCS
jgi:hypothetical protein